MQVFVIVICRLGIFVKGPTVTLNVPSVDFGLLKLGERKRTSLLLTNITQLEASWTLEERQDIEDSQVLTEAQSSLHGACVCVCLPLNQYSPDLHPAKHRCPAALGLLQRHCAVLASLLPAVPDGAAAVSGERNRVVRSWWSYWPLFLFLLFRFVWLELIHLWFDQNIF